ncbi:hypothetical protein EB001_07790 [bacterium]|nr:hypothetical protein [bacterium]
MGYTVGDRILDQEYNNFLNGTSTPKGINYTFGTGALQWGLGQTALSSVAVGDNITAAQWNSLFTAMNNVANHTNDTLTSTAAKAAGDIIAVKSALVADLTTLASSVANGSPNATALSTSAALQTSASSVRYAGSHVVEHSITFTNADQARYFFNAGGKIQINITRTTNAGTAATSKDSSVDELITALGNLQLKSQTSSRSGSGETLSTDGTAIGFHDLTTSYQTIIELTQNSGAYTTMYFKIEAKANAAAGSATVVTIKTSIVDPDAGDSEFTAGNTASVDQYANFIGTTNVILKTVNPTTAEGLATVYTPSATAQVSNTTV